MARPRRLLAEGCTYCGALPGQPCTTPRGNSYDGYFHVIRQHARPSRPAGDGRFSTDGIHPRTFGFIRGNAVIVRDASGKYLNRVAITDVIRGQDFFVAWVARPEEVESAKREGRDPNAVPWPAEDVWLPGDEPREDDDRA